jgi:hypothetical protein
MFINRNFLKTNKKDLADSKSPVRTQKKSPAKRRKEDPVTEPRKLKILTKKEIYIKKDRNSVTGKSINYKIT